jgi:hypothetical protein
VKADQTLNHQKWVAKKFAAAAFALVASMSTATAAPSIAYVATDLPDLVAGEDLWSYTYLVSGPLGSFESFNVFFSPAEYGTGISMLGADGALSPLLTPPMLAPDADGILSLTAVDPLPGGSTIQASVQFAWLGAGAPGAQSFSLLDDQFNVVTTGLTSAVPEVTSLSLVLAGLVTLIALPRRRRIS